MIKFTLLKNSYCIQCRKNILHEYGRNLETGQEVKQCINCDTLTEVKSEGQQNHDTPYLPEKSYQERSEDT